MTWYVVYRGHQTGVFSSWEACHTQVSGFKGACYKGYKSKDDAFATFFVKKEKLTLRHVKLIQRNVEHGNMLILVQTIIIVFFFCFGSFCMVEHWTWY